MHLAQLGRCQHGFFVALVALDLVRHAQFFQQPQHALRAGIVQVLDNKHGGIPSKVKRHCAGWQQDAAAQPKISW
jgi:hypothetical protein